MPFQRSPQTLLFYPAYLLFCDHSCVYILASALPFARWMVGFIQWVKGMGATGGVLYAVFYVAGTALFFPGLPLTLGAGFIYGAVIGTLVVSPASVAGASLA